MKLRGIDFGHVWDASGVRNFDGSGWWYHWFFCLIGLSFAGSTFVAKTITAMPRAGNMPLGADCKTPKEFFPKSVYVSLRSWWYGAALNAVGLSGPGVESAIRLGWWQKQRSPFFISFMTVDDKSMSAMEQVRVFLECIRQHRDSFQAKFGIQLNVSCPNVGKLDNGNFIAETLAKLDLLAVLDVPIVVKFSVTTSVATARDIALHPACDAVCISNTVPWGQLKGYIDWQTIFGTLDSPLEKRVGKGQAGGLSGAPLLELVNEWVYQARQMGFPKPLNVGGGILCKSDAARLIDQGADSIFIGSVAFLRPWRVPGIIRYARQHFAIISAR